MANEFTFTITTTRFDEDYAPSESSRAPTNFANLARGEHRQQNLRNALTMIDRRFNDLADWDNIDGDRYAVQLDISSVELQFTAEGEDREFPLLEFLDIQIIDALTGARHQGIVGNNFSSYVRDFDFSVVLPAAGKGAAGPIVPEERRGPVLDALGISSASLHPSCPMQIMSKANSRLLIGLQSPETLDSLQPQMDALVHLTPHVGADGFFVFALVPGSSPLETEARMFCPLIGIPEDPVSGNAHGMLGVYLLSNGLLAAEDGKARFTGHQGRFVDRPGTIDVEVTAAAGKRATSVRVTGEAIIVFEAELAL